MKRYFMMLVALMVAVAVAVPAFAAVELKYGGQHRTRLISQNNFDGTDERDDHTNLIDQRTRLYFSFIASENLKLVTKFEMGDTTWGSSSPTGGTTSRRFSTGGGVGADAVAVEVKNAYLDFNIPCTPLNMKAGIQSINLLNSWIIDDDFSALVVTTKMAPWTFSGGYIAAQNNSVTDVDDDNVDSFFLTADYAAGPWAATVIGYYQNGHGTMATGDPSTLNTPVAPITTTSTFMNTLYNVTGMRATQNNFYDLGLNLGYKVDFMSAYVSFAKNFGELTAFYSPLASNALVRKTFEYKGWMADAGANFYQGPWTFNVGGFYTTGPETNANGNVDVSENIDWFTYPLSTSKYFSEIVGGGILDNQGVGSFNSGNFWSGYSQPTNVWTITAGAAYQVLEKTKLSASYWYFGTSEEVVSDNHIENGRLVRDFSNELGHEFDFYVTQGIVDGLTLDLVAAYMIAGEGVTQLAEDDDIYELGARIQWNF